MATLLSVCALLLAHLVMLSESARKRLTTAALKTDDTDHLQARHANATAGSDCSRRFDETKNDKNNAACVVLRQNKGVREALLVHVYYGKHPGWDFPGGQMEKIDKSSCETAERETCEETKFKVKAVLKLTKIVYKCEIVQNNACRKKKDEGFLKLKWVRLAEVRRLQYRGGTWGNKPAIIEDCLKTGCRGFAASRSNALDSSPGPNGKGKPLSACQGDCDRDSDCTGDLKCFQRDGFTPVPGCYGSGKNNFDYCIRAGSALHEIDSTPGVNGRGKPNLQLCQGDCDFDSDCAGNLRCYQRDGQVPIPGCRGTGVTDWDYCVEPGASNGAKKKDGLKNIFKNAIKIGKMLK